mgnify:FL=1|tara:strand:+ start:2972 stop:3166 length:195 start_codon:yes stop_codon:yes gene_type:complete
MEEELKNKRNKLTERSTTQAIWVDSEIHQLLKEHQVMSRSSRSLGELAAHYIKLGICDARGSKK